MIVLFLLLILCAPARAQDVVLMGAAFHPMVSGSATFEPLTEGGGAHNDARFYDQVVFSDGVKECVATTFAVPQSYDGSGDLYVTALWVLKGAAGFGAGPAWTAEVLCVGEGEDYHTIDIPSDTGDEVAAICFETANHLCLASLANVTAPSCAIGEVGYPAVVRICRRGDLGADTANGVEVNLYEVGVQ
jgi:hypothetical protein